MRHLRRTGQARRRDLARTLYYVWRYRLGLLDIERAVAISLGWIRGRDEAEVRADCRSWYERIVRRYLRPAMAATVEAHRRAGHLPAILTSATRYLAEPVATDLGIEHLLVTQLRVRDGRFTGEAVRPLCYGEGKTYWAERFAAATGVGLGRSYLYTASGWARPSGSRTRIGTRSITCSPSATRARRRRRSGGSGEDGDHRRESASGPAAEPGGRGVGPGRDHARQHGHRRRRRHAPAR